MSNIRSFDPSKVERRHIAPKTLVYGGDAPGIQLRLDRFEEVLRQSGDTPTVFPNASSALGYLSSGDMFCDDIYIIIKDASDMLRSDTASKQLYAAVMRALATYGEGSAIVLGARAKKGSAALSKLISDFQKMGGLAREVAAPVSSNVSLWLDEYLKSRNMGMSNDVKSKLISASDGDADKIENVIDVIGAEIDNLTEEEIRIWLDTAEEANGSDIRTMLVKGDIDALSHLREAFAPTPAGYRMFLLRIRIHLIDLLIASLSPADASAIVSYKRGAYGGNGNSGYYIAREAVARPSAYFIDIYDKVNQQLSLLATSGAPALDDLLATIAKAK